MSEFSIFSLHALPSGWVWYLWIVWYSLVIAIVWWPICIFPWHLVDWFLPLKTPEGKGAPTKHSVNRLNHSEIVLWSWFNCNSFLPGAFKLATCLPQRKGHCFPFHLRQYDERSKDSESFVVLIVSLVVVFEYFCLVLSNIYDTEFKLNQSTVSWRRYGTDPVLTRIC